MDAFAEPWQARAFAMVTALQDAGLVTKTEWSQALSAEIRHAKSSEAYYDQWLAALESVVTEKDLIPAPALTDCQIAWARAADRTPHGDPIELRPDDFA
jgi:nitrile hydratase accessory protein